MVESVVVWRSRVDGRRLSKDDVARVQPLGRFLKAVMVMRSGRGQKECFFEAGDKGTIVVPKLGHLFLYN